VSDYDDAKLVEAVGVSLMKYTRRFGWEATIALLANLLDRMRKEGKN
jgi:hypothetical protein